MKLFQSDPFFSGPLQGLCLAWDCAQKSTAQKFFQAVVLRGCWNPGACRYSAGYDALAATADPLPQGMACLENLRKSQRVMKLVHQMLEAVNDKDLSGADLLQQVMACETPEFKPPDGIKQLALQRDLEGAAKNNQYDRLLHLLSNDNDGFSLAILDDEKEKVNFQAREITKVCANLLREEGKMTEVQSFIGAIHTAAILKPELPLAKDWPSWLPWAGGCCAFRHIEFCSPTCLPILAQLGQQSTSFFT